MRVGRVFLTWAILLCASLGWGSLALAVPTVFLVEEGGAGTDVLHRFKDGTLTTVGDIGFKDVRGLAWDGVAQRLYGVSRNSDRLIRIDPATGTGVAVGTDPYLAPLGSNTAEITVTASGVMYGAGHVGDSSAVDTLLAVDQGTGIATVVGTFGGPLALFGLAVRHATGTLYGTTFDGNLYTVDPFTGAATFVGTITGSNGTAARIAFDQEADVLYGITTARQLVTINLSTLAATEVAQFTGLNQLYSLDLVPRCGDGELDFGELCETGACCSTSCQFEPTTTTCRSAAGTCDVAETCTGTSAACPADGKSTAVCRAAADMCDVSESCNGVGDACPADAVAGDGTTCDDGNGCTITDGCMAGVCTGNLMTCGDGTVQGGCGEECDDGNVTPDDGCSATCTLEPCGAAPASGCRSPFFAGKALLKAKNATDNAKDQLQWKWAAGTATMLTDFGDPTTTDSYYLCLYDTGQPARQQLVSTTTIEAGGTCAGKPCWKTSGSSGFGFKDKELTPDGAAQLKLKAGVDGKAAIQFKGKGVNFQMPAFGALTGPIVVQAVRTNSSVCWEATYSAPFLKNDGVSFLDKAD